MDDRKKYETPAVQIVSLEIQEELTASIVLPDDEWE